MATAIVGEPVVYRSEVLVQKTIEAAGPGLRHGLTTEPVDEGTGFIAANPTHRPAREVDVHIDELATRALKIGSGASFNAERSEAEGRGACLKEAAAIHLRKSSWIQRKVSRRSPAR